VETSAIPNPQRKIKCLTAVVWLLAIALCVTVVVAFLLIHSVLVANNDFEHLSPEQRISSASVVALCRYERSGSTLRCIITEILKQREGTPFHYKVGDEFRAGNQRVSENTDFGDGEVLFFSGSPLHSESIMAYRHDRIDALGDMPVSTFCELVRASK
jgi:hypothetical protein